MSETPKVEEASEANKVWQEYLQKCCEVGQLDHALDTLDSQRRVLEKNLEVTKSTVKKLGNKHKENQEKALVPKVQPSVDTAPSSSETH